jgi:hypothetical protein
MNEISLKLFFPYLSLLSFSAHSQNILFNSSDEQSIAVPTEFVQASTKLDDLFNENSSSETVIKLPAKGILIERLIAFSSSKLRSEKNSSSICAELVSYLSTFCKIDPTHRRSKSNLKHDLSNHDLDEKILRVLQRNFFPLGSPELTNQIVIKELTQQIYLAEFIGNHSVKDRLSYSLADSLSYLKISESIFILPIMRDSRIPEETKILLIKRIGKLFLSTPTIKSFLLLIYDNNVTTSRINEVIKPLDSVKLDHILYVIETYFEPHTIQLLRKQNLVSSTLNRKRLNDIIDLQDINVAKIRTLIIANLAQSISPQATDIALTNVLVLSSLPTNTIAEIAYFLINKYPGLLLEFVDIDAINIRRELENKPFLKVLADIPKSYPFRKILSDLKQKFHYFSADNLYEALKITFETAYRIE